MVLFEKLGTHCWPVPLWGCGQEGGFCWGFCGKAQLSRLMSRRAWTGVVTGFHRRSLLGEAISCGVWRGWAAARFSWLEYVGTLLFINCWRRTPGFELLLRASLASELKGLGGRWLEELMSPSPLSGDLGRREVLYGEPPLLNPLSGDLGWREFCWRFVGTTTVQAYELRGLGRRVLCWAVPAWFLKIWGRGNAQ